MFVHLLTLLKLGAVYAKATFYYEFHRLPLEQVICSRHYMDSQYSAVDEGNALEDAGGYRLSQIPSECAGV
jgi:hypothetical protein